MDPYLSRFYLLFVLLGLFTCLFILQVWAIVQIKRIIKVILPMYGQANHPPSHSSSLTPDQIPPRRICQYCRFRETYPHLQRQPLFVYRCRLNGQEIHLEDFCHRFELDPLRAKI